MLSFLALSACAVGVELGEPRDRPADAGRDASVAQSGGRAGGTTQGGSTGSGQGGASAGGSGRAGAGQDATGSGGASAVVDASGAGGGSDATPADVIVAVDTSNGCVVGQKVCGGRCVIPEARVGCDLLGCEPCPSPEHSVANCTGSSCDFACLSGYARSGAACVLGDGGAGGGGGSRNDGGPTHCVASQCGGCIPVIQAPCCKPDDTCGCQYPFFPCN